MTNYKNNVIIFIESEVGIMDNLIAFLLVVFMMIPVVLVTFFADKRWWI